MRKKELIPPMLYNWLYRSSLRKYGFFGDYDSWHDVKKLCGGYDDKVILEKVKSSLLKVKNGEAVYERDSVLFNEIEYSWPLLSGLLWTAATEGKLNVLDFGGSLGSTYYQNRKFLANIQVAWNIVEQPDFVECGKKYFEDDRLRFYKNIQECLKNNIPNVALLSSVLPYIEKPFEILEQIIDLKIKVMIISKMPLINGDDDRLTIQKVPPYIYKASYPAWFFSKKKLMSFLLTHYDLIEEFDCGMTLNIRSEVKGFILRYKDASSALNNL